MCGVETQMRRQNTNQRYGGARENPIFNVFILFVPFVCSNIEALERFCESRTVQNWNKLLFAGLCGTADEVRSGLRSHKLGLPRTFS